MPALPHSATDYRTKKKKLGLKQRKISVWRNARAHASARSLMPYSECFQAKRGRLDAADESQQHIHHGRCVDVFKDQREESLLPTQETEHLAGRKEPRKMKFMLQSQKNKLFATTLALILDSSAAAAAQILIGNQQEQRAALESVLASY